MTGSGALDGGTAWFSYETAADLHRAWRMELWGLLAEVPGAHWSCDDVVVVVGELIANAMEHGGGARRMRVTGSAEEVMVEVVDAEPAPPRPRPGQGATTERGRGFTIVGALVDEWGWRPDGRGGKTVWARFGRPGGNHHHGSAA